MSVYGILNSGRTGMAAHTYATSVTAQNAENSATVGYTRRMARLENIAPNAGVRAEGSRRVIDPFLSQRMLGGGSDAGYGTAKSSALGVLDEVLADAPGNLGERIGAFEGSLVEFSAYPADPSARASVLQSAENLARAFNDAADRLFAARAEINDRAVLEVSAVNEASARIASLGKEIARAELGGREASDLRDLRDQELQTLAERVPIDIYENDRGGMTVLLAGSVALVDEDHMSYALETTVDPGTGDVSIQRRESGVLRDVGGMLTSGSIGGLLDARDGGLRDAQDRLDTLAFDLASAYNTAHSAGFGLDGANGRSLFEVGATAPGAAGRFAVSADVSGQPDRLAAASAATDIPGGNDAALVLTGLAEANLAGGSTPTGTFAALVGSAGASLRAAADGADAASVRL
ncbi:MAG: flagellar hook-associated protein FlgK [Myxococcota bacterium]